jgi:signal transduction histidine kinase
VLLISAVPPRFEQLTRVSDHATRNIGELTTSDVDALAGLNLSVQTYAVWNICIELAGSAIYLVVAFVVFFQRPITPHYLLHSVTLLTLGATLTPLIMALSAWYPSWALPVEVIDTFAVGCIVTMLLVFPNGQFVPAWTRYIAFFVWGYLIFGQLFRSDVLPPSGVANIDDPQLAVGWIVSAGAYVVAAGAQFYRFRRLTDPLHRRQTILILKTIAGVAILSISILFIPFILFAARPTSALGMLVKITFVTGMTFASTFLPIAIYLSIVRYRLWGIVIIVQRTVVFSLLTAFVILFYTIIVTLSSAFFQADEEIFVSLIATGLIAVLFQPLRERLQHWVERFVFGERHNPYAVISQFNQRLEANVSPNMLLPGIAETIAQALKLRYVSIALQDGDQLKTDAVYGQPADGGRITTLPLMVGQETVGQMVIGQGADDRALDAAERQLLDNIAQQTGIAAHAVQLSQALQQSRQQIITAREEERRRLRRDLHDGLGPSLAAHTIKVGTAKLLLESNPQTAAAILSDLENGLADSLTDIRRLVYNLRPPALDQLGLVGALRDFIQQCNGKTNITLNVTEPLPALPAAVEVAAYRIVQEAVTNVLRHADAAHCQVNIQFGTDLLISIQDDGVGIALDAKHGIGLKSMQERAEELGGRFILESRAGSTVITVHLPIAVGESQSP